MEHPTLLLLAFSVSFSSTVAILFGEPRIYGDDATGYGPVFEEQPQDLIYPEDSPEGKFSMNCRARANPPAIYKWRVNGWELKLLEQPDEHYSLVGGNLVVTNPIRGRHGGRYVCVAQNVYGAVYSKEAYVRFGYLEMFSSEEREAAYVKEGQGVVLQCVPPPHFPEDLTFRWMLNELPNFITTDKRRFVSAMNGNLYISKVELSDNGNYSCFVSSPSNAKSVFSPFIPLVPQAENPVRKYPADIRVQFPNTIGLLGQNVTLECFALGNPVPEIRWRKVDGELPASVEIGMWGMGGALLHIYNLQYEDEGYYECEALNTKGKDWHRAYLYVDAVPEWAHHINNTQKDIGSDLTLSCQANAKPWVYIRWLKNGYSYGKGDLRFTNLAFEDSGMFQCIAENKHGSIYANAELRVIAYAPTFEKNPVRKVLLGAKKRRVVIECKPRAAPRAKITWLKGTEQLSNSSRVRVWYDGSLVILNATTQDEGRYTCFAENDRGKANSSGVLTITEATKITTAPSNIGVDVGQTTRLPCAASHDPSLDITFIWSVDTHVIDFDREEDYELILGYGSSGELRIRNTRLKHAGHYTCTAQTIVDNVTASAELVVRGPPGPPGGLRVEDYKDQTARLLWSRGSSNHSPILRYFVQARDSLSLDQEEWKNITTAPPVLDGLTEMASLVGLTPWTEYEFRVIATNALGTGEPSVPAPKIRTWEAVPVMPPTDVSGHVGGVSKELTITWTPVSREYYYGRNFGYVVLFKPHDWTEWKWVTVSDPEARRYVYKEHLIHTSMFQATEFQVKVKPYNSQGEGPSSLTSIIYAAHDVPTEAPADVSCSELSATEALIWWLPVFQQPVDGYQIRYWRKYYDNEAAASRYFLERDMENHTRLNEILPYWRYRVYWRYYNEAWVGMRLENMLPDSHYMVEVRAYNDAGLGPPGDICEMFTKKPPPNRRPKIISKFHDLFRTWVYIAWQHVEPMYNESRTVGYKVMIKREGLFSGELILTGRHYMFVPVPTEGDYLVEIRARSEGGDGPISRVRVSAGAVVGTKPLGIGALLLVGLCSLSL